MRRKITVTEHISIHSLRMEGDVIIQRLWIETKEFQSTPSAWRETNIWCRFSPESEISIHSLRMEGDPPEFSP